METGTSDLSRLFAGLLAARRIELPSMPETANDVMALCRQETTDAARLSAVVHRDQAIATNVLRVANSAAYVGQVPCASLQQAISRLGLRLVADIATAVAMRGPLFQGSPYADLLALLWKHSLLAGFFTKEIARLGRRNVEVAFLGGLLHDVGKAVLLGSVGQVVGNGEAMPPVSHVLTALHEQHVTAGCMLAAEWKMPEPIGEAIRWHHEPASAPHCLELTMTVALADALAHHLAPSVLAAPVSEQGLRQHEALDALNLYPDQLDALLAMRDRALHVTDGMQ